MWLRHLDKAGFLFGLVVLSFLYGYAASNLGWFPSSFLERAWLQGKIAGVWGPDFVVPRVYRRSGARRIRPENIQPGLTLIATVWSDESDGEWKPGIMLIDASGRSVHEWQVDPEQVFPDTLERRRLGLAQLDFHGVHLFRDGDIVANLDYVGTIRIDACSQVKWRLMAGNHHSIERSEDGTFWIPGVSRFPLTGSTRHPEGFPGLFSPVFQDLLMRVTADGQIVETLNVMDLLYENGLERHLAKMNFGEGNDVTHLNDIESLSSKLANEYPLFDAGDLVVSLNYLDLILVVDPRTRRVKWHISHPFIRQHDPDFVGEGWIGVFDNNTDGTRRGSMLGGSRVVAVQPHTDSVKVLFPTSEAEPFYTKDRGKWQLLENGNLLLTESAAGRIVEVDSYGRTVWEWVSPPFSETEVPYVSEGARTSLRENDVADWPCSSTGFTSEARTGS